MKKRIVTFLLILALLVSPAPAALAAELSFSDELVTYLKTGEGFVSTPYSDGTGWYIGYGCACNPADYPAGITEAQADALLRSNLVLFADSVNAFLRRYGITVTQSQFDAMLGMSYALGPGWLQAGNRLPDYLIRGIDGYTDHQIAEAFAAWCHVGGRVNTVALSRRIMEAKMFLYGDYAYSTAGWCWLLLNVNGGENEYSDVSVYPVGKPYETLPQPTRGGWYFAGWQTADGTILRADDLASASQSVTAVWSAVPPEASAEPSPEPVPEPTPTPVPGNTPFPDIPGDAWYTDYVLTLHAAGVIDGFEDGSFRPQESVTWGQALKLILLASGYAEQTPETKDAHWASGYLRYAEKKGFLAPGTVTDPDAPISRNALADLCAAALELTESVSPSPYADSQRPSVLKLYAAGIMEGSLDGDRLVFLGSNAITRAEICAVLVRVQDYVARTLILFAGYRIPIDYSLRFNSYDPACFTEQNGRIYYDDGETAVRYGIDVSAYQGKIDWAAVAADGIDFAMIRCGYRGYGQGTLNEDACFRQNMEGALAAGLDVGVYFFSQALTAAEAREEAAYTLKLIAGYPITFPVTFDWEIVNNTGSRTRNYARADVADFIDAFCSDIAAAGYRPLSYFNPSLAYLKLDLARVQRYDGWLAHYVPRSGYPYDYQMWQYGSNGTVAGISGRVDMDIAFTDFAA